MKKAKKIKIVIGTIIILIVSIIIISNKKVEINNNIVTLIVNNKDITESLESGLLIKDDVIYLEKEDLKKSLDDDLYEEDEKIILSGEKKIAVMEIDKREIEINGATIETKNQCFKNEEGQKYIPIEELKNVYDFELTFIKEYNNIIIDFYSKKLEKAYTKKDIAIKKGKSILSKNVEKLKKGTWIIYIEQEGEWAKVRTQNGNLGYIKKKNLTNFIKEREEIESPDVKVEEIETEIDITNEKIEKYEQRKKIIEKIMEQLVESKKQTVKIKYENEKNEDFKKFSIEAKTMLKECGITVVI